MISQNLLFCNWELRDQSFNLGLYDRNKIRCSILQNSPINSTKYMYFLENGKLSTNEIKDKAQLNTTNPDVDLL